MPILSGLRRQFADPTCDEMFVCNDETMMDNNDETLISDSRSGMRPVQIIERKFGVALQRESGRSEWDSRPTRTRFE